MGVFQFYSWFRKQFPKDIYKLNKSINRELNLEIDNLMIDMNGLFHTSAQKIFKYGNFKPPYKVEILDNSKTQQQVFNDICQSVENILMTVNPNRRLILCVDGPAPVAKQVQQRKRRYKSSLEREDNDKSFDSNCISPGTLFMDNLSKYIDWFIRSRLSENPLWQNLEIIYSSSSVPGEGEQKILMYIRKFGRNNESFVMHGLDADLIMLSLLTHFPKFYILRDDTFDHNNNFLLIDIGSVRNQLIEIMRWENDDGLKFNQESVINDFVFLCFVCGNDFLPNIPSIEIIEGGVEVIMSISKSVGKTHGHITRNKSGNIVFCKTSLKRFFEIVSESEKELLEQKYKNRKRYFEDKVLEKCTSYNIKEEKYDVDIDKYRNEYNEKTLEVNDEEGMKKLSHSYLTGLQWILKYYTKQVPSWSWYYNNHYAPLSSSLIKHIDTYDSPRYHKGVSLTPFQQLLCILPPKSSSLLPKPLDSLLSTKLKVFNPTDIEIDLSGKLKEYMGIVKIPFVDINVVKKVHNENIEGVVDKKRDLLGKSLIYTYNPSLSSSTKPKIFYSYYGNIIDCKVNTKEIDLN
jgi:5'-3' exoribonuclease 1